MLARLEQRIEEARRDYEDRPLLAGSKLLLETLAVLVADARRRIGELVEQAANAPATKRREVQRDVRQRIASETGRQDLITSYYLDVLANAHGRAFDPFIGPIGRLAGQVAEDTELIVSAVRRASEYEITQPINSTIPGHENADDIGPAAQDVVRALPPLILLRYPANEEPDCFHHLLLGHEIAHLALRRDGIGERLAKEALESVRARRNARPLAPGRGDMLPERSHNWFTELACDQLGVKIIGPALLLALYEYAALHDWQYDVDLTQKSAYNRYPALAWRLRELRKLVREEYLPPPRRDESPLWRPIRQVFDELEIPSWRDPAASEEKLAVRRALRALVEHEHELLPEPEDARALRAVMRHPLLRTRPELADFVRQNPRYDGDRFRRDVEIVWQKLGDKILPAEDVVLRGDPPDALQGSWDDERVAGMLWSLPLDWRSILNGAYLHWWAGARDAPEDDSTTDRAAASAMARGAVELSEIHLQALALRDELRVLSMPGTGA